VTAEVRLKQFRKSQKVRLRLFVLVPTLNLLASRSVLTCSNPNFFSIIIAHFQEAKMRNQGSSGPSRVPPLKGVPNGGELSTEDTAKRRQQFQDKELSMAIKNALMKKAQLQQESGVASTPGRRSQPETQRALAQPSLQTVKRLGSNPGSLAGSGCNPTQLRLSAPTSYTGVQKTRGLQLNNSEIEARSQGDFATSPDRRSKTMLALTNATNLTIPGRSADFRSEVRLESNHL